MNALFSSKSVQKQEKEKHAHVTHKQAHNTCTPLQTNLARIKRRSDHVTVPSHSQSLVWFDRNFMPLLVTHAAATAGTITIAIAVTIYIVADSAPSDPSNPSF
jgi:hypothetical protein